MARKPVRSPFVVTVAVIASSALPGCGGQVAPASTPTTDGGFEDTSVAACPASQPAVDSPCAVDSKALCEYPMGCGTQSFQCRTGAWKSAGGLPCNPPPVCPPIAYEGAPCKPGFGACLYPDTCPGRPSDVHPTRTWYCSGDRLRGPDTTTDYVVKCPASQPKDGDPCPCAGHYAGACTYGDCYGTPTATAQCDDRTQTWRVAISTCNPPPPDVDAGSPDPSP